MPHVSGAGGGCSEVSGRRLGEHLLCADAAAALSVFKTRLGFGCCGGRFRFYFAGCSARKNIVGALLSLIARNGVTCRSGIYSVAL